LIERFRDDHAFDEKSASQCRQAFANFEAILGYTIDDNLGKLEETRERWEAAWETDSEYDNYYSQVKLLRAPVVIMVYCILDNSK
jgi:hypothetical protein